MGYGRPLRPRPGPVARLDLDVSLVHVDTGLRLPLVSRPLSGNDDLDLVLTALAPAPLGYLLHHRGHTHTLLYVLPQALTLLAAVNVPEVDAAVVYYGYPPLEYIDAAQIKERYRSGGLAHRLLSALLEDDDHPDAATLAHQLIEEVSRA